MPRVTKKYLVAVVCIVLMLSVICWYKYNTEPYEMDAFYTNGSSDRRADGSYSATKDACQFPYFDPSHPHAMRYFKKYPTTSCPDGMPTISYYNGEQVKINMTKKIRAFGKDKQLDCWYRKVTYQRSVNYMNGAWIGPFRDSVKVQGHPQFVEVKCQDGDKIVSRMHHYVTREEERRKAAALSPPKHDKQFQSDSLNVLMLCIDSMARHLLTRAMPKTRKYLLETLGAVELHKYNKVGSNTFPNLLAVSAGIFTEDVPSWTHSSNMDELPFLWRDYKSAGYRTQYATDRPDFDDFTKPPTDSFTSPLAVSMMQDKIAFDNNCFEDQVEVPMWLNLVKEFARESIYSTGRFYSFTMMNRPTHDFPNQASAVDEHYYNFLKEMHETGVLNNTFMAFFGDHGPRMSAYRRTYFGSVEERAALMTIYVPKWFRVKYKEQYKNLLYNKDRLTTNFDVHETVRNLLSLETGGPLVTAYSKNTNDDGGSNSNNNDSNNNNINNNRNNNNEKSKIKQQTRRKNSHDHFQIRRSETGRQRAFSLFTKIPRDRTCADAAVSPHWCMCNGGVSVVDPDLMKDIGNQVVNDVNDLLQPKSDLCEKLSLKSVTSLSLMSGKVGGTFEYRIMLTAEPSGAALEATVGYSVTLYFFRSAKTIGIPSRLDFYRGQSDCVSDEVTLKMFCYCKDFKLKNNVSVSDDINDNNNNNSSSNSSSSSSSISRGSSSSISRGSSSSRRRRSSSSSSSRTSSSGSRS